MLQNSNFPGLDLLLTPLGELTALPEDPLADGEGLPDTPKNPIPAVGP